MFRKGLKERTSALPRQVRIPGAPAPAAVPALAAKKKVALFVAHGMGQQVPFETMDAVAEGLARVAELPADRRG